MNITVQHLTKHYTSEKLGVTDLSFSLTTGEVMGLIGLNGSGKTTTMKLLCGLLKKDSGHINIFGQPPKKARALIAYHGDKDILYPWLSPKDGEKIMTSFFPDFDSTRYERLLNELEVPNKKNKEMSKGQKSRFRLALTLARKAKLYILDEPLSGVDIIARKNIVRTIISEWREDATMIMSTHEIESAQSLFESILILDKGKIALREKTKTLQDSGKNIVEIFEEVVKNERT